MGVPGPDDLARFRDVQQLLRCAEGVAAELEPGVTEREAATWMKRRLLDQGVDDWFHLRFAWFGNLPQLPQPAASGRLPGDVAGGGRGGVSAMAEYRIDDLAREAGTTVRNVRAYQDRGLLPPPRREGRAGIYTEAHLARLQLIGQLLERGYNLANIAELLSALERGHDIAQLLRLEAAIISPWSDEVPSYVTLAELLELFGSAGSPEALAEAISLGILEAEGERFRVPSPRVLHAGAELVAAGVPLSAVFDHARQLRRDVEHIASRFVQLVATHVFDPYGDELPPPEDLPRLAEVVQRLRPLAEMMFDAELALAMERSARAHLGERLTHILDHEGEAS